MRKALVFFVVIGLAVGGFLFYQHQSGKGPFIPESKKIMAEMDRVLDGNRTDLGKVLEYRRLESKLASAYVDEGKYDHAISIIENQIKETQREGERDRAIYGRRHSSSYAVEAAHFNYLAIIYERKQAAISAAKSKKKAEALEARASLAAKSEPKEKSVLD